MIPFGTCLLLWRQHRGLSQSALAQKAGIPQPNLSDIERGEREVSLRTLRALALALDIRPGLLADGIGPEKETPLVLTRERLERVARSVVEDKPLKNLEENQLAEKVSTVMTARLQAVAIQGVPSARKDPKKAEAAWRSLNEQYRPEEIQSLVERVSEKAAMYSSIPVPNFHSKGTGTTKARTSASGLGPGES